MHCGGRSTEEVEAATAEILAQRAALQASCLAQLSGVAAIIVGGTGDPRIDGKYVSAENYQDWPHFVNEQGSHLFRHVAKKVWRIDRRLNLRPTSGQTLQGQLHPDDGQLPLEAGAWHVLRDIFWKTPEFSLSIALVK